MKKISLPVVVLFAALIMNGYSDVRFRWYPDASSLQDKLGVDIASNTATVLTYVSGDTTVDFDPMVLLQNTYGAGLGADTYMGVAKSNALAGRYATSYEQVVGDDYVGKYVYAVVLHMPIGSFTTLGTVPAGTNFNITTIGKVGGVEVPLVKYDSFNAALTSSSFNGGAIDTTLQIIPEPTGAAMVLLGLGVVALRRMKARNIR